MGWAQFGVVGFLGFELVFAGFLVSGLGDFGVGLCLLICGWVGSV